MDINTLKTTLKLLEIDYYCIQNDNIIVILNNMFKDKQTENLFLDIVKNNNFIITTKIFEEFSFDGSIIYVIVYHIYER